MSVPSFRKILPYALVVFFGYVGFSMPLPMLPQVFLDAKEGILPAYYSRELKMILLGIVMTAYPLGQFIGAPILGKFSDRWGRKRVIVFSLVGSMLSYVFTAIAMQYEVITAIFLGLFLGGLCEGNVSIAQSVVADLVPKGEVEHKAKHLGWINLFACFAFIVGPILGGQLSDSTLLPWFTFATPFWVAAGMTLIGLLVILKFSEETKRQTHQVSKKAWREFRLDKEQSRLRLLYVVNFFLAFGYFSFFRFSPVYMESKFNFSTAMQGYIIAYGSISFAIFSALLLKPLAKWMTPVKAVQVFAVLLAISLCIMLVPNSAFSLLFTFLPINMGLAVIMTYSAMLISESAPAEFQGRAFGVLTSMQVLAEIATGLVGGYLAGFQSYFPILLGSLTLIVASILLRTAREDRNCC